MVNTLSNENRNLNTKLSITQVKKINFLNLIKN